MNARRLLPSDRAGWTLVALLTLFLGFYIWTAGSSIPISFHDGADGVQGQLADALLHGRTSLQDAPPGLTALQNPYDPGANAPYRGAGLHDLSLYNGRIYSYFGPTPAVLLFGPARVLGFSFSEVLAAALFAFLGLLFSVLLLRDLVRRFLPQTPAWMFNAGVVLLGFANVVPYTIRRSAVYEVAIGAGLCFAMAAAWLLVTGALREQPSLRRLALGSLCLGLAVGARPSHIITTAVLLALTGWLCRKAADRRRMLAALLGPVAGCAVLLALYNYARFDSFTEFGLSYQMAGVDVTSRKNFQLGYLLPGLWYYLIAPARALLTFPFVQLGPPPTYPGHVPALYDGVEPTGGIFALAPLSLLVLLLPFGPGRRLDPKLRTVLTAFVVAAIGLVVVASVTFWGVTMRYEVDFSTFLLIPALMIWFAWSLRAEGRARRLVVAGGTALLAWGAVVGLALGFTGSYTLLRLSHPALWGHLTHTFSPVSRVAALVTGDAKTIADIDATPDIAIAETGSPGYLNFDRQPTTFTIDQRPIKLRVVAATGGDVLLTATTATNPVVTAAKIRTRLRVQRGDDAPRTVVVDDGGALRVPVHLHGGVNDVVLTAQAARQPAGTQLVQFTDLAVHPVD